MRYLFSKILYDYDSAPCSCRLVPFACMEDGDRRLYRMMSLSWNSSDKTENDRARRLLGEECVTGYSSFELAKWYADYTEALERLKGLKAERDDATTHAYVVRVVGMFSQNVTVAKLPVTELGILLDQDACSKPNKCRVFHSPEKALTYATDLVNGRVSFVEEKYISRLQEIETPRLVKLDLSEPEQFEKWAACLDDEQKTLLQNVLENDRELNGTLYFEEE